jgi:hypothetical protein
MNQLAIIVALAFIILFVGIVALLMPTGRRSGQDDTTPFKKRDLLNKSEQKVFADLAKIVPSDHHLMCQVSYGAVLQNPSRNRYMSINSKRADFMIFDEQAQIVAVIEYQGSGHYGRSHESKARATESDRIKRSALSDAGIPLLEIPAKYAPSLLIDFMKSIITAEVASNV